MPVAIPSCVVGSATRVSQQAALVAQGPPGMKAALAG
jgi:hypothetical protein